MDKARETIAQIKKDLEREKKIALEFSKKIENDYFYIQVKKMVENMINEGKKLDDIFKWADKLRLDDRYRLIYGNPRNLVYELYYKVKKI